MKALYPASAFGRFKVDEHFENEVSQLAEKPAVFHNDDGIALSKLDEDETYLYRGWILTPGEYRDLEKAVQSKGAKLAVTAEQYEHDQYAQNWLTELAEATPETVVVPYAASDEELLKAAAIFTPETKLFIKGSSKSAKDNPAASIAENVASLTETIRNFREEISEEQEELILIRKFVDFIGYEYRTWWSNGVMNSVQLHPQTGYEGDHSQFFLKQAEIDDMQVLFDKISPVMKEVSSPLVTVDIRRAIDGDYHVIEMGSGTVSETIAPLERIFFDTEFAQLLAYNV